MVGGRFIYISRACADFDDSSLRELADKAAAKNARHNITGVLMKTGDYLVQVVDGPYLPVTTLLQAIGKDPRHSGMRILYKEPVTLGLFSDWSMSYLNLDTQSQDHTQTAGKVCEAIQSLIQGKRPPKQCMLDVVALLPDLIECMSSQGNRI